MPRPRVAVLIDLPREAASGGHVKYWERLAQAAASGDAPVDLTLYFSGTGNDEILSPHVRFRFLPPVFSTARLKFLPYVPAHTDLAGFHPQLAQELPAYDVINTTDGFFAFARTAERIAKWNRIPLVTSLHTDTPAYAEVFTRQTLESLLGKKFGGALDRIFKISARAKRAKEKRLAAHIRACAAVIAMRPQDIKLAQGIVGKDKVTLLHLAVDKNLFVPDASARAEIENKYGIAPGKFLVLAVGRVDVGKNMHILAQACAEALKRGANLHLIIAGIGPLSDDIKMKLGGNVTLAGWQNPESLARLYAAADILAMASDIEIGGMVALEAASCGCPVLVSRPSDVAQGFGEPDAMKMVESGITHWVQILTSLAQNPEQLAMLRRAAIEFRDKGVAGWKDILDTDFVSVWQNAARRKGA